MDKKFRLLAFVIAAVMLMSSLPLTAMAAEIDEAENYADDVVAVTGATPEALDVFTGAENTETGTKISWSAVEGAAGYALYLHEEDNYVLIAETEELSYTHTPLESGKEYVYSLRAIDSEGEFITYYTEDYANTYYAPPVISSLKSSYNGVKIVWNAVEGVEAYRIYRKSGSSAWSKLDLVSENTYLDTSAQSGKSYTYTVSCVTADGETDLSCYNAGKSINYVKIPAIKSFSNTLTGTKISFDKPDNVAKLRVYYKGESGWTRIGETSDTSIVHDKLTGGVTYKYTVRGVDSKGNFVTDFNSDGWDNTFVSAPVISFSNTAEGVKISWKACAGAERYRVYYYGKDGWRKLGETNSTSYVDKDVKSGSSYTYTVRCISADGKTFTSYYNSGKKTMYVSRPGIKSFSNTATGTKITWNIPTGAKTTRVYVKGSSGWTKLTETTADNYTHDKLTAGKTYVYTVRCLDGNGNFVTDYNSSGWNNTFIEPPVISSLESVEDGMLIKWKACEGAVKYRVYYKGSDGWTKIGETAETSFVYKKVESGSSYTFTVRCISADGKSFTSYYNSGKKGTFVATPVISSIENTADGAKISWAKVTGADHYRVYYKVEGGSWTRLVSQSGTSYTDKSVKDSETRIYTVRCLDSKDNFVSDYHREGWSNTFFAAPEVSSVTYDGGYTVKWEAKEGVAAYRLYRRTIGGSWARLFDSTTDTSYVDDTVESGKVYAYTLRYMDEEGNLISGYLDRVKYYKDGELVNGNFTDNGSTYGFKDGYPLIGLNRVGDYLRYYNNQGKMYRNAIVGSSSNGYYYTDSDGICIESEEFRLAAEFMAKYCKGDTLKERMKYAFMYLAKNFPYRRCYDPPQKASDIPALAIDMFKQRSGNCYRYAACFACIAKIAGYRSRVGVGITGSAPHGWTEVYVDGRWLICDVDANLPTYGVPDYYAYMMKQHFWPLTKYFNAEVSFEKGKAVWK